MKTKDPDKLQKLREAKTRLAELEARRAKVAKSKYQMVDALYEIDAEIALLVSDVHALED